MSVVLFSTAPPASTRAPAPRFPFHPTPRLPGLPSPGAPQLVPTRVWSEHKTQEGKIYFYNKVTKQSVWEKPKDFELVMPLPADFNTPPSSGSPVTAARQGMCAQRCIYMCPAEALTSTFCFSSKG